WRSSVIATPQAAAEESVLSWQPWSRDAVASARSEGRPILVDFTASWCLTCNTQVKPALEDEAVRQQLEKIKGIALLADYSTFATNITEEIKTFGRAGVPLLVIYPKNSADSPIVLREPVPFEPPSHYRGLVLDTLTLAAK